MPPNPDSPGNLEYIINLMREKLADAQTEVTGSITNISQSIVDVWEMDCGGKWTVYVKTGTVALTKALWLLLTPSLGEILENYLEPKPGRRGGRRGQRGRRERRPGRGAGFRLFFRPPIPDIDNAIANLIPGHSALSGRRVGPGEFVFWTGINVADAILWHWLLLEATETFSVTWQSEIIESGECQTLNDGTAKFTTAKQTPFFNNNLWFAKSSLIGLFEENLDVLNNGIITLPVSTTEGHCLAIVLGHWTVERDNTDQVGVWKVGIRIVARGKGGVVREDKTLFTTISAGPGQSAAAILDIAVISEGVQTLDMLFVTETIQGANTVSFECWADVSVAMRGVHVV